MDEEPPHPLNVEAVNTVLTVALMMNAKPVDEIHVMRKTVIDGSNTTGFQRTCAIALDGKIQVGEKVIPIQHLSLEEDAARKTGDEEGNIIRYHIDRLGIPLIEVTTAPVIYSPNEAGEVALAIGSILRATGKVKRGLGTIRQDINVSITNGALIEIKGVQELELVPLAVEFEVQRQLNLLKISEELRGNGIKEDEIRAEFNEVTDVFKLTKSKVIRRALDNKQQVLAVRLPKFRGFLKRELLPDFRLGTEMADRARFWGRVGGIFHTDEMPAYGVTQEEVHDLRAFIKAEEDDAVVFVADALENAQDALKAVVERAKEAIKGVPEETRAANPDGTTRYMRPKPGAARMYPETDIPQIQITQDHIQTIRSKLPELPEQKMNRLVSGYGLNQKLAKQILESQHAGLFETVTKESGVSPTIIAVFLTETLKALKRDGVRVDRISESQIKEIFKHVGSGSLMKESTSDVVIWLSKNEGKTVQDAIAALGLKAVSGDELEALVSKVLSENRNLVKERGEAGFGIIMGILMKDLRGKVDAARVSKVLKEKL
ncbi:Glu-tRNA(Gln) amidotransferase subunit GatE, partial [Candidatus Bathyarchaeota archaeon]|nr:Glu-tRNA(Gln) amidotransferase subunit GatE [Candidatus Bathyarchaeota archaeon]